MTSSTRWKIVTYTTALFVAGAICGAVMMPRKPPLTDKQLKLGRSEEIACLLREKLHSTLDLTPEQLAKFEPLIKKTSEDLEASHHDCLNRIAAALENLHTQICADLKPDQKQKLKKLEAERIDLMWQKYRYRGGDGNTISN